MSSGRRYNVEFSRFIQVFNQTVLHNVHYFLLYKNTLTLTRILEIYLLKKIWANCWSQHIAQKNTWLSVTLVSSIVIGRFSLITHVCCVNAEFMRMFS